MKLPTDCSDKDKVASFLIEQTINLARIWRDVLTSFKEKGVEVPTLSVRGVTPKKEVNNELKEFRKKLLDHVIKYRPKVIVPPQIQAINTLYELGKTVDECIELFEESMQNYNQTSWLTVRMKIVKNTQPVESEFDRKELDPKAIEEIQNRIKNYGKGEV